MGEFIEEQITLVGKIYFDPKDRTNKHKSQASWKKMAMVIFNDDLCEYYSWFVKKRFGLELTSPLRGSHISFINDSSRDMNGKWDDVKKKWHKKEIEIILDIKPHMETPHWWLIVPHDKRGGLQEIRNELGLGKPFFGMHMTIGTAVDKKPEVRNDAGATTAKKMNVEHSNYISNLINKGFIKF